MAETILFSTERPSFHLISEVYDPLTNPNGSVIPRPGSIVLDMANDGLLQRVVSVDVESLAVTYGPVHTSLLRPPPIDAGAPDSEVSVIDYGNSRFYLYYDKAETPTKLNIDKKVIILGDDAQLFEIVKYDTATHQYQSVSLYFDNDGVYRGTKIPLASINETNAKSPTNCHTSLTINDDEVYWLIIYDYAGTQCGSVKLFAKRGVINNVVDDDTIITDFFLTATQIDDEGLYLYPDQSPSQLLITPKVLLDNGTVRSVPIDQEVCHLYGLEGFTAAYPGQETDLLVKYYLTEAQQAVTEKLVTSGSSRYLMKQVKLRVKDPGDNDYTIKILTVPRYVKNISSYILTFYLYTSGNNQVHNITSLVTVTPMFGGTKMGDNQELMLEFRLRDVYPDAESDFYYQQPVVVKVNPHDWVERYILRDTLSDSYGVYGVDSPVLPRPMLYYDQELEQYFIPTSRFSNINTLLEAFYYKARPLYDNNWLEEPIEPTHFTIRNSATGVLLLSAPIPVDGYEQSFSLINVDQPNQLVGINCIVEWLRYENGSFNVLYGAPVDVYQGTYTS